MRLTWICNVCGFKTQADVETDASVLEDHELTHPNIDWSYEEVPLSPVAAARLEAGLASAKRGEIEPWGSFVEYAVDEEEP